MESFRELVNSTLMCCLGSLLTLRPAEHKHLTNWNTQVVVFFLPRNAPEETSRFFSSLPLQREHFSQAVCMGFQRSIGVLLPCCWALELCQPSGGNRPKPLSQRLPHFIWDWALSWDNWGHQQIWDPWGKRKIKACVCPEKEIFTAAEMPQVQLEILEADTRFRKAWGLWKEQGKGYG